MMTPQQFDQYFTRAQQLAACLNNNNSALSSLLQLIDEQRNCTCENVPFEDFLKGEYAFFTGKYRNALQHYLQAKSIPYFKLFCYRASAYASKASGEFAKAMNFAQQALAIYPNDYATLTILEELFKQESRLEEAEQLRHKIQELEQESRLSFGNADDNKSTLSTLANEDLRKSEGVPAFEADSQLVPEPSTNSTCSSSIMALKQSLQQFNFKKNPITLESAVSLPPACVSSLDSKEPASPATLTQRFYAAPLHMRKSVFEPDSQNSSSTGGNNTSIEMLKKFSTNTLFTDKETSLQSIAEPKLAHDNSSFFLEQSINTFRKEQEEQTTHYLELFKSRPPLAESCLFVLHGWNSAHLKAEPLLTEQSRKMTGGFYLRWEGKGIVINPGKNFLENFHQQGLHIKDINYVIVTRDHSDAYSDVREIYELNHQLNKASSELQIIHYYLSQKAYQTLSPILKPNFKQERNTVHCLELFLDSPDVENVDLGHGIEMTYFPISIQGTTMHNGEVASSCLGVCFELRAANNSLQTVRLGYVASAPWSSYLPQNLGYCDVLITGFGNTSPSDYGKLKYNEDCLGYFGTFSLLTEVNPRLLLCSEFSGTEGDIRLEVVKLLRREYSQTYPNSSEIPVILPCDTQFFLDLKTLQIQCSLTKMAVAPSQIRTVMSANNFGSLHYLSPYCCS